MNKKVLAVLVSFGMIFTNGCVYTKQLGSGKKSESATPQKSELDQLIESGPNKIDAPQDHKIKETGFHLPKPPDANRCPYDVLPDSVASNCTDE